MKKILSIFTFTAIISLNFFYFSTPVSAVNCCVCNGWPRGELTQAQCDAYNKAAGWGGACSMVNREFAEFEACEPVSGPTSGNTCCVCPNQKIYQASRDTTSCEKHSTYYQKIYKASCSLKQDPACAYPEGVFPPTPTMTKLGDEFKLQNVVLGVTIPGLTFSPPPTQVDAEGNISIPWLAEYIKALYNFAVVIISIIAVVVIILQGAKIITSAGGPAKGEAYKRITQAVIGLFVAWGSYVILYSINPGLTAFKPLTVAFVPTDALTLELGTTQVDTIDPTDQPSAGTFTSSFPNCPLQLSSPATFVAPEKEPRTLEFYNSINSVIKADTVTDRVAKIADAASKCGVHLGSCGRTAGTIYALAGLGDPTCLKGGASYPTGCIAVKGKTISGIPYSERRWLANVRCGADDPLSPCANSGKEARQIVYNKYKEEMPTDWPDSWANNLQPGDYIIVYNGNSSPLGTHAALFVGWASGGRAQVIQGSWGKIVSMGTVCIKSSCSPPESLIEVTRPNP